MVAVFVQKALAAAGIQCVEREPGLLRVYAHPSLQDLLHDEPWIELVFDEAGLHEHPGAMLCVPGSYPLDRILALVQAAPRAFSSRAELETPTKAPPGGPRVENAPAELRFVEKADRSAVRMLVRVRLQSDETVEHLFWVAAGADGRERPDLLAFWETAPRSSGPAGGELSPETSAALERQAGEAALRLAESQEQAAAEHRAAERERLERFHQALVDELPAQLSAAPAKRVAQARAETGALLELLRTALPADGPWKRAELFSHGWWPFRRPGKLPSLDYPDRAKVRLLLDSLPPVFTWADVERQITDQGSRRLERLMERLRSDPEAASELAAAEARLLEEHQARLADLDRKLHLRTLVTPRALEVLTYPVSVFDLHVEGGPTLRTAWNPLAQAWEPLDCPTCAAPAGELWLCRDSSLGCGACASRCSGCERVEPRTQALPACAVCETPACPDCGAECAECGRWGCPRHCRLCPACEKTRCSRCGAACETCGGAACGLHREICGVCRKTLCAEHQSRCGVCQAVVCPDHRAPCPICLADCCTPHQTDCRLCGQHYCARCVPHGECETCRTLEPVGTATETALRSQLAEAAPEFDLARLRGWKLGRNTRYRVVTARAWPWHYRFVLEDETGKLLHQSRTWSPFHP